MATISTRTFAQLLGDQAAAVSAASAKLYNFATGTLLRGLIEANASVALWLQALVLQVLQVARLSTSAGADVDTYLADFGMTRLAAQAAAGQLTFGRFQSAGTALVPVGARAVTADGSQLYTVIADTANAAYSAALGGYQLAAGIASLAVAVQAVNAGAAGNVAAGAVSLLASAVPGIDTVTNLAAFANGADAETDDAVRARFVQFIGSLSKGTPAAIGFAVNSVKQGLVYTLTENFDYPGTVYDPGFFFVVVDDGTGAPPASLLTSVSNAIDAVRAAGTRFGVFAPTVVNATIILTIDAAAGYSKPVLQSAVATAILAYVNALPIGGALRYSRVAQVAYDASPGVANVRLVTVNGAAADLAASAVQVVKSSAALLTVN